MRVQAIQRAKMAYHAIRLIKDPNRLNEVFMMIESVRRPEIAREIARKGAETPEGARALRDYTRVHIDLPTLSKLPLGTLGREFAEHMRRNKLDPSAIPSRPANDEVEYVEAHLYETHDIWHAVTGFNTDVPGELGLQAFYFAQLPTRLPPILMAGGLIRTLLYDFGDRDRVMDSIAYGWTLGKQAKPFFGVRWDDLWETPLAHARARFHIAQA